MNIVKRILSIAIVSFSTFTYATSHPTVLISIDGFAQHYLDTYKPKNLLALSNSGLSAKALLPVFPSKTFPNHLSIVTGKYPGEHGIIHNSFYRRDKQEKYTMGAGRLDESWLKADPIWITAEKNGITSASFFWPESEASIDGIRPSFFYKYDGSVKDKQRLEQVTKWLQMPEPEKPRFITTYFSLVDTAGHDFGTRSQELADAIETIDQLIGDFVLTLDSLKVPYNLVIVSDHGMFDVHDDNRVLASSLNLEPHVIKLIDGQTQLMLYTKNNVNLDELVQYISNQSNDRFEVYKNGNFPKHWHLNHKDERVPDIVVNALPPYHFGSGKYKSLATHGYDVRQVEQMGGIFIANGVDIKAGRVAAFENLHVHSFLLELLSLPQEKAYTPLTSHVIESGH